MTESEMLEELEKTFKLIAETAEQRGWERGMEEAANAVEGYYIPSMEYGEEDELVAMIAREIRSRLSKKANP